MKQMNDLDYVELYANRIKNDNRLFSQQKKMIESQLHSSSSLFTKMLSGSNFKKAAREYLKNAGLL